MDARDVEGRAVLKQAAARLSAAFTMIVVDGDTKAAQHIIDAEIPRFMTVPHLIKENP